MSAALPPTFKLERYFDKYEFTCKHLLCCSDAEPWDMNELLALADEECQCLWGNLTLSYTHSQGHPLLREEVGKLHDVTADQTLIIAPQEGIYIAMKCLVAYLKKKHGTECLHAVATYPAYQSLYENLKTLGCDMSYWRAKWTDRGWYFDMQDMKSQLRDNTRLLIVNFPHNPTGYVPVKEEWEEILEICRQRQIFLFSDEMYRLTNNDESSPLTSACAINSDAITLFGMSKTFALPGLRIGWLCTRNNDVMNSMRSFKDYTTICSSAPSEILALIGLRNRDILVNRTLKIIRKNLKLLEEFFSKHNNIFEWVAPTACTTGFLRLKGWALDFGEGGASGFCDALVKQEEVLLLPADVYDFDDIFVRISYGRDTLSAGLAALDKFIGQNKPK